MLNHITITGNIAADAELKSTNNGKTLLEFRIGYNSKNGKEDYTKWVRCVWWGQYAIEHYAQRLTKGKRIVVSGRPAFRPYTTKDGKQGESFEITVDSVDFIAKNDLANMQAQPQQQWSPQQYQQQMAQPMPQPQMQPQMQQQPMTPQMQGIADAVQQNFPGATMQPVPAQAYATEDIPF